MRLFFAVAIGFLGCLTILMGGLAYNSFVSPLKLDHTVFIKKGIGKLAVAELLENNKLISSRWVFLAGQKYHHASVKAGEYFFSGWYTPQAIMTLLHQGKTVHHYFTIPEGQTTSDILTRLKGEALLQQTSCQPVCKEGVFLPETYDYQWGDSVEDMTQRFVKAQKDFLNRFDSQTLPVPLMTLEEVIILASIVEKETALSHEMPHVASVFLNRLNLKMPLQADSTVLYGLKVKGREPSLVELGKDTSYNTYIRTGLPPGPICNPGKKAIEAVMMPVQTDDLFFVANGQGGHSFSKTLQDHQKNHALWRKLRAETVTSKLK